jgi:hypothetical protein
MLKNYRFRISGVHYAANPEAETMRMADTEEMHEKTRALLRKLDSERPVVSLQADPSNHYNPDCVIASSKCKRIGRVADECVSKVKSLLAQSEDPILFAHIEEVVVKEHGWLTVCVEAEELKEILPLKSSAIDWSMWLKEDLMRLSPHQQILTEMEAYYMLKNMLKGNVDEADLEELRTYLDLWMQGSCHDLSRETREARTQLIAQLENAQREEIRRLNEPLKEQRTSICGRMALIERTSQWWTERLESEEMQRFWMEWWLANEGQPLEGLKRMDEQLRRMPGGLYGDMGKRDVVLSRLYYMNTPRRALDAIVTLLMLRELTCRKMGIEMRPMMDDDYAAMEKQACGSTSTAKAQKKPKKTKNSFAEAVVNTAKVDEVVRLLKELMEGKTKPRDVMMPVRAAMDAGVIRRPTWEEFRGEFGKDRLKSKTSLSDYTNLDNQPYVGTDFDAMKLAFEKL